LLEMGFSAIITYLALTAPEISIGQNLLVYFTYLLGL